MSEYAGIRIKLSARNIAEGAGARVRRVLPHPQLKHLDPFVLLDEFYVTPPASFPDWNTLVYVSENQIFLNETEISSGQAAVLEAGGHIKAVSRQQVCMVLITGKPHEEPIRLRGSFVE